MADNGANMGKGPYGGDNSGEGQPGYNPKGGSVFPKKKKHVSTMMAEKIGEACASAVKNVKKNQKVNPGGEE